MKKLFCCFLVLLFGVQVAFSQLSPKPTKIKHVRASKKDLKSAKWVGYENATNFFNNSQVIEDEELQKYMNGLLKKILKYTPKHFRYFS